MSDPPPAPTSAGRFPLFDSLRAIAALSVLFYHAGFFVPGLDGTVGRYVTQHSAGFPALGVVVFFLISGFLLYRPFAQARFAGTAPPALGPYALRRVLRIVPGYWLALVVLTVALGLDGVFTPSGLATYFGFLQVYDVRTLMGGIGQAWTLDVELTFYAALGVIALVMGRYLPRTRRGFLVGELRMCLVLLVGSLVWQIAVLQQVSSASRFYYPALLALPASFDFFALGMGLAIVSVAIDGRRPGPVRLLERAAWLAWLMAAAAYLVLTHATAWWAHDRTLEWVGTHELRGIIAIGLILPAVFGMADTGWVRRLLGWRPVLWMGKVSYGIYLWHVAVLYELGKADGASLGPVGFLALAVAITLGLAALSWYGLEQHAVQLGRRISGARPTDVPAAPARATPG